MDETNKPRVLGDHLELMVADEAAAFHRFQRDVAQAAMGREPPECFDPSPELLVAMVDSLREARDLAQAELERIKPYAENWADEYGFCLYGNDTQECPDGD